MAKDLFEELGADLPTVVRVSKKDAYEKKSQDLLTEHFPDVEDDDLWIVKEKTGFVNVPRTLPVVGRLLDEVSEAGPLSSLYLCLWFRTFDRGVLVLENPRELLFEMGQNNSRAEKIMLSRFKELKRLGFIDYHEHIRGEPNVVVVFNPYVAIAKLIEKRKLAEASIKYLVSRLMKINSNDLHLITEAVEISKVGKK